MINNRNFILDITGDIVALKYPFPMKSDSACKLPLIRLGRILSNFITKVIRPFGLNGFAYVRVNDS